MQTTHYEWPPANLSIRMYDKETHILSTRHSCNRVKAIFLLDKETHFKYTTQL